MGKRHGSAKVVELPKGSGRWYVRVHHNCERMVRKAGSGSKGRKAAEKLAGEINEGINRGEFGLPKPEDRITFEDYSKRWIKGHVAKNLKWNTRRYYADMLQRIPISLQRRPLDEITREDVRKLAFGVLEDGLARSTSGGLLRTISAVYNSAAEDGVYRGANPAAKPGRILRADDAAAVEDSDETDCMTQEETRHFLKVARKHFGANLTLFLTALRTAARQGELVGLAWEAIDWNGSFIAIRQAAVNGEIQSTKNRQRRNVPITPQLVEALKEHRRRSGAAALEAGKPMSPWVFPSPAGGLMDPSKMRKELSAALTKAGIRGVTFHSLRHSALTAMAENGVPMAVLQRIAGHSSIHVTARYYLHVQPENHGETLRALASMDDAAPQGKPGSNANSTRIAGETQAEEGIYISVQAAGNAG